MDTKHLQKEINSLTGKLDRTFAVTDEMVFKVTRFLPGATTATHEGISEKNLRSNPKLGFFTPAFQDAKKDESVRKSYKYLAALHDVRTSV